MSEGYTLLPDFDHLPKDIKEKLDEGIYTVGESKQVDGNLRAVILDEEGARVKDITLKQVHTDPDSLATTRRITTQLQMRQISAKLDDIQELQSYQVDRDRDRDIVTPLLNARDYVLRAQEQIDEQEQKQLLRKASDQLTSAINAAYTDICTSAEHLEKMTRRPIFRQNKEIMNYMGFITRDLQMATKFVGVHMHVLDYIRDSDGARLVADRYQHVLQDFFTRRIGKQQQTISELLHMNFPYTSENQNSWYYLSQEIKPRLNAGAFLQDNKVLLVSMEDSDDKK